MEEVCALPAEDALRKEVEAAVRRSGPAAEATWADLLSEDRALRHHLQDVQVPVGLEARLLSLPSRAATTASKTRRRVLVSIAMAACALLVITAGIVLFFLGLKGRLSAAGR